MGDSWITIVAMAAFFILPIIFGNKRKKPESAGEVKNELEEFLSGLGMDDLSDEERRARKVWNRSVTACKIQCFRPHSSSVKNL